MMIGTTVNKSPWLQAEELTIGYGHHCVLDGVSLSISLGETIGIIGKNGTGKSTLMNAFMGLGPWTDGRLVIDGKGNGSGLLDLKGVAYIPQHNRIVSRLSVDDHLRLASWNILSGASKSFALLLDERPFSKLMPLRSRKAGHLSGGEQFLLALACSWLSNQTLQALFLDEPTAGLDQDNLDEVQEILSFLKERKDVVIVMIEQNLPTVLRYADRILLTVSTEKGRHSIRELSDTETASINSFLRGETVVEAHHQILNEVGLQ